MLDLSQRLQNTRQYAVEGLRELSEHPSQYLVKAGKGFASDVSTLVRDYWDAGVAAASGIALSPAGNHVYGSLFGDSYTSLSFNRKLQVGLAGALISLIGASVREAGGVKNYLKDLLWIAKSGFSLEDPLPSGSNGNSVTRNFYAGLSPIVMGIDYAAQDDIVIESLMKAVDSLSIAGFFVMDNARRRNTTKVSSESAGNAASEKLA